MTSIESITLEVPDPTTVSSFYTTAFAEVPHLQLRAGQAPTSGFRGFTLSLVMSQRAAVDGVIDAALKAGATTLKPAAKAFWGGYSGVVRAPDGTIWKIATAAKKDAGPPSQRIDEMVLLLGVANVAATKRFYLDHGLSVAKSFGSKYVEFATSPGAVKLGLYARRALAKDAGISPEGTGSHRIIIGGNTEPFTDPDGFTWEPVSLRAERPSTTA
jgi:predicted lactoylglutathione lyase